MTRTLRRVAAYALAALVIAAACIAASLAVTPAQQVTAAGQTIDVGVTGPSLDLSGPGELDLFGQQLDTSMQFAGPIRPRIQLTRITLSDQLKQFLDRSSGSASGGDLSAALIRGFRHYFYWQVGVLVLITVVLSGAVAGWLRRGWRRSTALIAGALVVTVGIDLGAIMVTAYTVPAKLRDVHSLQALVGDAPDLQAPVPSKPAVSGSSTVVIGDSTAAGLGNPLVPDPTPDDRACGRSIDAYANALANAGAAPITNLACSGATIPDGLLGPQVVGGVTIPAQVGRPAVTRASTVIVSVGANDVRWSDQLKICAISVSCSNNAQQAAFQQSLARLSTDYLQLLAQLQALPRHPQVIINLYYDPFGGSVRCLSGLGVTSDKQQAMLSKLYALNQVLAAGAKAASFTVARPNFGGHGLCSALPFVQGVDSAAPFHPTAAGELAIALADEHAMHTSPR